MPKRKQYAEEDLQAAVSAVKQGRLSSTAAARDFGVPRKTVADTVSGRYLKHSHGPQSMLTQEEESSLVAYIKYMQQQGFPLTREIIRHYVVAIIKESGRATKFNLEKGPSDKWFRKFLSKYPELTERAAERQDRARARMSNETVVKQYFDLLQSTIKNLGLENRPQQIFNCDETGFSGKEKPKQKVIGEKGQHFYQQALFSNTHITLHMCIAADGKVLPSFIIFEKSLPHTAYKDSVPSNWMFGYSESGYMDSVLFCSWFKDLFLPNCGKERPVLLVMDNHDSHISLDVIRLARENNVELLGLPPHTTHFLQPLDVGINGPLKAKVNSVALNLGFVNKHQTVNKAKFPSVLSYAIDQFCSPANVKSAFRKSGLFPVDFSAIDKKQFLPAKFVKTVSSNEQNSTGNGQDSVDFHSSETQNSSPASLLNDNAVPSTSKTLTPSAGRSKSNVITENEPSLPTSSSTPCINQTCDKCGSFIGENPLVKEGLVPPSLSSIFLPVPSKPLTSTKRKTINEARVISSNDFFQTLQQRSETNEKRKEEVAKRKIEREERKKNKEKNKSEKNISVCEACQNPDPPTDSDNVQWICCDTCNKWYHLFCVGLGDEENVNDIYFICTGCSNIDS